MNDGRCIYDRVAQEYDADIANAVSEYLFAEIPIAGQNDSRRRLTSQLNDGVIINAARQRRYRVNHIPVRPERISDSLVEIFVSQDHAAWAKSSSSCEMTAAAYCMIA